MPQLQHATFDEPDTVRRIFERDGGVIIDDFITAEAAAEIRSAFAAVLEDEPWCNTTEGDYVLGREFFGLTTKRLHGVIRYHPRILDCMSDPDFVTFAREQLGERIILSTGELMAIGPGEIRQVLHRDGDSWHRAGISSNLLVSINIALTPFEEANGATVVVPGSHQWDPGRQPTEEELTFAEMSPGSALLYSGRVLHSGGANSTDQTRMGLYFGYIPAWLRPIENTSRTLPADLLNDLPPGTQQLLGYSPSGFDVVL